MNADTAEIRKKRAALRKKYGVLFESVAAILFEADPMGINLESNFDEYEPEAGTIIPRLNQAHSVQEVEGIIHEEFCRWFDAEVVGASERYRSVASEVWQAWSAFNQRPA